MKGRLSRYTLFSYRNIEFLSENSGSMFLELILLSDTGMKLMIPFI
jgi:hypothetical protein